MVAEQIVVKITCNLSLSFVPQVRTLNGILGWVWSRGPGLDFSPSITAASSKDHPVSFFKAQLSPVTCAPQDLHSTYLLALLTGPCSLLEVPPGRTRCLFLQWLRRMLFFSLCSLQKPAAPFLHDFWRLLSPYKKTALSCDFQKPGMSTLHSLVWTPEQTNITWELVFSRIVVGCWCTLVGHPKHHGTHLWHICHRYAQQNPKQRSMHFFPRFVSSHRTTPESNQISIYCHFC